MLTVTTYSVLFYRYQSVSQRHEKYIKGIKIREETKFLLFIDIVIVKITQKILQRIGNNKRFHHPLGYKFNIQK